MVPNEVDALWGIQLDPDLAPDQHARYMTNRLDSAARLNALARLLIE
jgi:hypothetical protein